MTELIVVSEERVESLIHTAVSKAFAQKDQQSPPPATEQPAVYHTREYVRDLLHTTFPTLQKYTEKGLLTATYFGRRVLYREDQLQLALPRIKTTLGKRGIKPTRGL